MRHRVKKTGLRKTKSHLKSLYRNQLTSLFKHEKMQTTKKKAKIVSSLAEKLITNIKGKEDREAIRHLSKYIVEEAVSKKVLEMVKTRYAEKQSGFTSIYNLGIRLGDGASKAIIQLN
jgi:large subunit ribosomal protein L17